MPNKVLRKTQFKPRIELLSSIFVDLFKIMHPYKLITCIINRYTIYCFCRYFFSHRLRSFNWDRVFASVWPDKLWRSYEVVISRLQLLPRVLMLYDERLSFTLKFSCEDIDCRKEFCVFICSYILGWCDFDIELNISDVGIIHVGLFELRSWWIRIRRFERQHIWIF